VDLLSFHSVNRGLIPFLVILIERCFDLERSLNLSGNIYTLRIGHRLLIGILIKPSLRVAITIVWIAPLGPHNQKALCHNRSLRVSFALRKVYICYVRLSLVMPVHLIFLSLHLTMSYERFVYCRWLHEVFLRECGPRGPSNHQNGMSLCAIYAFWSCYKLRVKLFQC
jgi:hypothetical protein